MAPSMRFLLCGVIASVFVFQGSSSLCLLAAIPEIARQNTTVHNLPVGIFNQDWHSAQLVAQVAKVLISEVLGYNAVISGSSESDRAAPIALVGCVEDESGLFCGAGPVPDDNPHHAAFEVWQASATLADVKQKNSQRVVEAFDAGYEGQEGMYVLGAQLQRARLEGGVHLEFYSYMDAQWNAPWQFFSSHHSVNVTRLSRCADTVMGLPSVMEPVTRFTPDSAGIDGNGQAVCPDGFWWLSPACRANASTCIPWITGGDGWIVVAAMQRSIEYNIPLAVAVAKDWDEYVSLPFEVDSLVYYWEPAVHFLQKNVHIVQFKPSDKVAQDAGDYRTDIAAAPLKMMVGSRLATLAPRVYMLIKAMKFSMSDVHFLMELMAKVGDYATAACMWIQSTTKWQIWVPDEKLCSLGQGLVDQHGAFVDDPAIAKSCAPCTAGLFSQELSGSSTRACRPCAAGSVQPLWGMEGCDLCVQGQFQSNAGRSLCERCRKGSYSNGTGSDLCATCPAGETTDGTGLTSGSDCGCPPTTHSDSTRQTCTPCGEGFVCHGFGAAARAAPGYQLAKCSDELCVFQCHGDPKRCPGGGLHGCAAGREGVACGECEAGKVEVDGGTCVDCEGGDSAFLTCAVLCVGLLLALFYLASGPSRASQSISVQILATTVTQACLVLQTLSAVSRLTVGWVEPASSLVHVFSALAFDIEWLRWGCFGDITIMSRYVLRVMIAPCCVVYIIIVHLLAMVLRSFKALRSNELALPAAVRMSHLPLMNSIGGFVMIFLVAITSAGLSPFLCRQHPNKLWTMVEYEAGICWHGSEHKGMVALASIAFLVPTGFLAYMSGVICRAPAKITSGDVDFLQAHAFLFARVRPQHLSFALAVVLRNLCVATFPAVPDAFWQVFLEQCAIAVYSAVILYFRPWRLSLSNFLDIAFGALFLVILSCAGSSLPEGSMGPKDLGILVVTAIITLCVTSCVLFIGALIKCVLPKAKRFHLFLCHQKQSSGALARLLNLHLSDGAQGREVFLDSDHLSRLDKLFGYVKDDTGTLVVLMTSRLLHSAWCLGEVATAFKSGVVILPVYLQGFEQPNAEFIEEIDVQVDCKVLVENGIKASEVKEAVSHLLTLPPIEAKDRLSAKSVANLAQDIAGMRVECSTSIMPIFRSVSWARQANSRNSLSQNHDVAGLVVADGMHAESFASAMVLIKLLQQAQQTEIHTMVIKLLDFENDAPEVLRQCAKDTRQWIVLVCFTNGCFHSLEFILGLTCSSCLQLAVALPVVIPDDFQYPTKETYASLVQDVASACESKAAPDASSSVSTFVKLVFNSIACRLSVHSDRVTLLMQAANIRNRIQTGLVNTSKGPISEMQESILGAILDSVKKSEAHQVSEPQTVGEDSFTMCHATI